MTPQRQLRILMIVLPMLLARSSLGGTASETDARGVFDDRYATACGPIACYVALRALEHDLSLEQMVRGCRWKEGDTVGLHELSMFLQGVPGVTADPVRLGPVQLREWLSQDRGVAILAVRKNSSEINHAVAAVGVVDGEIILVDYPELEVLYQLDALSDDWDGAAILLTRGATREASLLREMPLSSIVLVTLVLGLMFGSKAKRSWLLRSSFGHKT